MKTKSVKTKGKLQLSKYFQNLKSGESVTVSIEGSQKINFPGRIQGRTGIVEGKRGSFYIVKIKDQEKEKDFIIAPINLRRIKT
ncbi:MAG: 50S ribosomal protein L21e [Nanoarchaeota archaeon]